MASGQVPNADGEPDDSTRLTLESVLDDLPLRNVVLLSEGKVSLKALDRLLRVLNVLPTRKARA